MSVDLKNPEIRFACDAVKAASLLAKQARLEWGADPMIKGDSSPVTVADFAGQALIGRLLSQTFPEISLVGEESSVALRAEEGHVTLQKVSDLVKRFAKEATPDEVCRWIDRGCGQTNERFWTVDPIDGTKGFIRGDHYVVALALIENGEVALGVLGCPRLALDGSVDESSSGSLVVGVRGEGAWITSLAGSQKFTPLRVSNCEEMKTMHLLSSVDVSQTSRERTHAFLRQCGVEKTATPMDSQVKYAALALGTGDLFFYLLSTKNPAFRMKIWDVAAGALIVEEAGGRVSDLEGRALDYGAGTTLARNPGILATNGHLHDAVLEALKSI